ncbi:MAG: oligosaccharide flippase family protein [Pseudomonadales bacterium]|nr:oligosaccharide flippase family protein [Pseudomonadales bacterium]NRA14007.1 oligosaccharide flippase family protein [Oceanospirillaceae bacterium]
MANKPNRSLLLSIKRNITELPKPLLQSMIYAGALVIGKGLSLIMVPVSTHYLSLEDYGRLDILQTLADLLSIVIGMGLAETLYRFASSSPNSDEQREAAANIFAIALLLSGCTLVVSQLFAEQIASWLPGNISVVDTRLILASLAVGGVILLPLSWLRITDQAWRFLFCSATMAGMQVTLGVVFLILGFAVTGILTATLIACLSLGCYLVYRQYKDVGCRLNFRLFKKYSVYGGPLVFVGIAGFVLGSFDRWLLAAAIGTAEMAQYALACKFGLITAVLIQPYDLWWHAKRFQCLQQRNGRKTCAKYASIGITIALFSALLISFAGPLLVRILTPQSYHPSIAYIPYLAMLAAVHNITATLSFGMLSANTTWRPAIIDGTAAAIGLIGYLILIPIWQIWGAISATAIALTLRLIISYQLSQKTLPLPYPVTALLIQTCIAVLAILWLPNTALTLVNVIISLALLILFIASAYRLRLLPITDSYNSTTRW